MFFECKHHAADLSNVHASQPYRYFSVTEARFAVLTLGTARSGRLALRGLFLLACITLCTGYTARSFVLQADSAYIREQVRPLAIYPK